MIIINEYFILSLRWSTGDNLVWWGPNNSGYCVCLESAGRYTPKQVRDNPDYYDDGDITKAIPVSLAVEYARKIVPADYKRDLLETLEQIMMDTGTVILVSIPLESDSESEG